LNEFIGLLKKSAVEQIVDVRTIPRSRHNPQFNFDALSESLQAEGINYVHMPGLGGLRRPKANSVNTGWRNASFRGFADYMQTQEFEVSLTELIAVAKLQQTSVMCAESLPWRCHRSLIADALYIRGILVKHILSLSTITTHKLTTWAEVKGIRITYPHTDLRGSGDTGQLKLGP
jgi:uncharacterized protein (DUF488 family)